MENEYGSLKQLFQQEFTKMVAVISKLFGLQHIETAEDIVSETFLLAAETWGMKGIPPNPTAWLYTVAKQKTLYHFRRNKILDDKVMPALKAQQVNEEEMSEPDFSPQNIKDSQLQMLFAICSPVIASEAQIGLALRILCGFGIDEIAHAFLTNKETINKRLFRAKEKLREEKVAIEFPGEAEIGNRLEAVLTTLYLLFNEGYYSESQDSVLREDLCLEAMRLTYLLLENPQTNLPKVKALLALMCFHASRFAARKDERGEMILYHDQDTSLWNAELISKGTYFLHEASRGDRLSTYHLEAAIAYWHTIKEDTKEKWENILQLYNQLLQIRYSPIAALNRTYALSKTDGKQKAIAEAEKLKLDGNPFYFALLGELYTGIDDSKAERNFHKAFSLAGTAADKQAIQKKLDLFPIKSKSRRNS